MKVSHLGPGVRYGVTRAPNPRVARADRFYGFSRATRAQAPVIRAMPSRLWTGGASASVATHPSQGRLSLPPILIQMGNALAMTGSGIRFGQSHPLAGDGWERSSGVYAVLPDDYALLASGADSENAAPGLKAPEGVSNPHSAPSDSGQRAAVRDVPPAKDAVFPDHRVRRKDRLPFTDERAALVQRMFARFFSERSMVAENSPARQGEAGKATPETAVARPALPDNNRLHLAKALQFHMSVREAAAWFGEHGFPDSSARLSVLEAVLGGQANLERLHHSLVAACFRKRRIFVYQELKGILVWIGLAQLKPEEAAAFAESNPNGEYAPHPAVRRVTEIILNYYSYFGFVKLRAQDGKGAGGFKRLTSESKRALCVAFLSLVAENPEISAAQNRNKIAGALVDFGLTLAPLKKVKRGKKAERAPVSEGKSDRMKAATPARAKAPSAQREAAAPSDPSLDAAASWMDENGLAELAARLRNLGQSRGKAALEALHRNLIVNRAREKGSFVYEDVGIHLAWIAVARMAPDAALSLEESFRALVGRHHAYYSAMRRYDDARGPAGFARLPFPEKVALCRELAALIARDPAKRPKHHYEELDRIAGAHQLRNRRKSPAKKASSRAVTNESLPSPHAEDEQARKALEEALAWLKKVGMSDVEGQLARFKRYLDGGERALYRLFAKVKEDTPNIEAYVPMPLRDFAAWLAIFQLPASEDGLPDYEGIPVEQVLPALLRRAAKLNGHFYYDYLMVAKIPDSDGRKGMRTVPRENKLELLRALLASQIQGVSGNPATRRERVGAILDRYRPTALREVTGSASASADSGQEQKRGDHPAAEEADVKKQVPPREPAPASPAVVPLPFIPAVRPVPESAVAGPGRPVRAVAMHGKTGPLDRMLATGGIQRADFQTALLKAIEKILRLDDETANALSFRFIRFSQLQKRLISVRDNLSRGKAEDPKLLQALASQFSLFKELGCDRLGGYFMKIGLKQGEQ